MNARIEDSLLGHKVVKIFDRLMYLTVVVAGGIFMINGRIVPGDLVACMLYVTTLIKEGGGIA